MAPTRKKRPSKIPLLVLTPGDPDGIGPEITWKVIRQLTRSKELGKAFRLLCIGARKPFDALKAPILELPKLDEVDLEPPGRKSPYVWLHPAPTQPPQNAFLAGFQSGWSIEQATKLVLSGKAQALVTGPISKERLQKGGYPYPGHTEFLADLCQDQKNVAPNVTMMLANDLLRVSLVTTHISLHDVSARLTREKIRRTVFNTVADLKKYWGIAQPSVAVAALNPHAGESGLFGQEEIRIISPEIQELQVIGKSGWQGVPFKISGPHPADTLFAQQLLLPPRKRFDAVICMYHDQGLIPVKLLDFRRTVNVTLGLPMIRTSVDHGTAFDIVGKGLADPSSLQAAIKLASRLTRHLTHSTQRKG